MKSFKEYHKNNNNNKEDIPTPEEVSERVNAYREDDNRKKWAQLREEQKIEYSGWDSFMYRPDIAEKYIEWATTTTTTKRDTMTS